MTPFISLILFLIFSASTPLLFAQEATSPTPTTEKESGWNFKKEVSSSARWRESELFAFGEDKPWQTNGVLIIKDDTILFEKYANGFNEERPHRLWSVTKSLSGALIGKRLEELKLNVDSPLHPFELLLSKGLKRKLTFRNLLQMSSGLNWNEFYESNPFESHVVDMLYIKNYHDMGSFVAKRPLHHTPGQVFNYSSGETNLLMKVLRQTFENQEDYNDYPWKVLFEPLGIKSATWEQDKSGTFVGSSYGFMTANDLARFGRLMLAHGQWNEGEKTTQILPKEFVKESFNMAPAVCQTVSEGRTNRFGYGFQWWLNKECPNKKLRAYPDLPQTLKMALGHHGQGLFLFPELNAIVVRFGADKKERFKVNDWLKLVYQELKK